ncbi:MAG TPA: hypothetical protein VGO67_08525 [Verrucomicrobiae bacterium]
MTVIGGFAKVTTHTELKTVKIMRTKTMLLSALLGTLGSVSLMAQSTNVYSLNAVGYINVTVQPGFNIVSCPLIASPDNTLNTLLPQTANAYAKWQFWTFSPVTGYTEVIGKQSAWSGTLANAGTNTLNPGQAAWLFNPGTSASNITFVGTVPSSNTTTLTHGSFNLVSSALPVSGVISNKVNLMGFEGAAGKDQFWQYIPGTGAGTGFQESIFKLGVWTGNAGDATQGTVGGGFFYFNAQATDTTWTQNFSVSQN